MRLAMTLAALTVSTIGPGTPTGADASAAATAGADTSPGRPVVTPSRRLTRTVSLSHAGCPDDRKGLAWYRARANELRAERGTGRYPTGHIERTGSCGFVHWKARQWMRRAAREARLTRRWRRQVSTPAGAIRWVFGPYAGQALAVAFCESRLSVWARNGQYLGLFQMGDYARSKYGHSWTAIGQARSAYAYFQDAGWSPWACRP